MHTNQRRAVTGVVDPIALRQELKLREPIDIRSPVFERFVIRLSECLDLDIPPEDYAQLATVHGCAEYLRQGARRFPG